VLAPADARAETASEGLEGPALDKHEGIGHPSVVGACDRWPKSLRLASNGGHLVPGRCRATRLCDYCSRLAAVEWAELLALDAMLGVAPTVWMVLTTRETKPDLERVKKAKRRLLVAIRRRWPGSEYCCIVEFTTGYGKKAGGRRRPHWNVQLKGVPVDALDELQAIVDDVWTRHLDAVPDAQFVGDIHSAGGLMRYLVLHFLKEEQRPPSWWRGHRVTRSRGYLWDESWKARHEAQESLRFKREIYRAEREGYQPAEAFAVAELRVIRAKQLRWECVELTVDQQTGEVVRGRPIHGMDTIVRPQRPLIRPGMGTLEEWRLVDAASSEEVADLPVAAAVVASLKLFEGYETRRRRRRPREWVAP